MIARPSAADLRRLAVESDSDPRTVARVIAGARAKGMVDARIRRVLTAHGIELPTPQPTNHTPLALARRPKVF